MTYNADHETFHSYTAALPSLTETEDFETFTTHFLTTNPPLMTQIDLHLLECNTSVYEDLAAHYDRAIKLKIWRRTHYTHANGTKKLGGEVEELPNELKTAHRLLMIGEVGKGFPSFNGLPITNADKKERERWRVINFVLIGLRNVAFEMVGVESVPPMSMHLTAANKPVASGTGTFGNILDEKPFSIRSAGLFGDPVTPPPRPRGRPMRKAPVQIVAQNESTVFAKDEPSVLDPNWGSLGN
jgi:hypothetical protein